MKIQGFLDQLLKSAQGGGSTGNTGSSTPSAGGLGGLLNADFGKGALTGGALGLLLGKNKTTRKLATYGGLAAIGVMAYKAYGDYKQQQGGANAGVEPQTVDRLPPPQAELHSQAILKALVAAAKADGHIDTRERGVIEGEFSRVNQDAELQQWLHAELEKPLDPAEVAARGDHAGNRFGNVLGQPDGRRPAELHGTRLSGRTGAPAETGRCTEAAPGTAAQASLTRTP